MTDLRDVQLAEEEELDKKQDRQEIKRSVLVSVGGAVTVTGRPGYVWHQPYGATQPGQIYNRSVQNRPGTPVLIGYKEGSSILEVLGVDPTVANDSSYNSPLLANHHTDHEPGGGDMMWLQTKAIQPLAVYPAASGLNVNITDGDYPYQGERKTYAGKVNLDLSAHQPASGNHLWVGVYLDSANAIQTVAGTSVAEATALVEPSWPAGAYRLAVVELDGDQTTFAFADVENRKLPWAGEPGVDDTYLALNDTPDAYTTANALVQLNSTPDALIESEITIDGNRVIIPDSASTAPLNVTERSAAPSSPNAGDVYLDDGTNTTSGNPGWRRYTGAAWEDVGGGGGSTINNVTNGRLSLANSAGNSLNLSLEYSSVTEVFLYPWRGNQISLYDGSADWDVLEFSTLELKIQDTQSGTRTSGSAIITGLTDTSQWIVGMEVSGIGIPASTTILTVDSATQITMSANATSSGTANVTVKIPASTMVDIFAFDNSGTPKLEFGPLWTNDTTRATALTTQDGIYVKSGATTRKYLGTLRTTATAGQSQWTYTNVTGTPKLFLWNMYNRVPVAPVVQETTDSWTYTTTTWRQANGSAANQFEIVTGVREDIIDIAVHSIAANSIAGTGFRTGVGVNSTSANSSQITEIAQPSTVFGFMSSLRHVPRLGYSYYAWLENSAASGTTTWYGDAGAAGNLLQSGMNAVWWC